MLNFFRPSPVNPAPESMTSPVVKPVEDPVEPTFVQIVCASMFNHPDEWAVADEYTYFRGDLTVHGDADPTGNSSYCTVVSCWRPTWISVNADHGAPMHYTVEHGSDYRALRRAIDYLRNYYAARRVQRALSAQV